jgi:hypothetical protein
MPDQVVVSMVAFYNLSGQDAIVTRQGQLIAPSPSNTFPTELIQGANALFSANVVVALDNGTLGAESLSIVKKLIVTETDLRGKPTRFRNETDQELVDRMRSSYALFKDKALERWRLEFFDHGTRVVVPGVEVPS